MARPVGNYYARRLAQIEFESGNYGPPKPGTNFLRYRSRIERIHEQRAAKAALKAQRAQNRASTLALERAEILGRVAAKAPKVTQPVALYKYPLKTGSCTYCGYICDGFDHVIPYAYMGKSGKRRGSSDAGIKVPCCRECNVQIGRVLIVTVVDRAAYLLRKKNVQKRYSRARLEWLANLASHS